MRFCHFLLLPCLVGKSYVVASWQRDFCLLFKPIKIFSDLLSMGAVGYKLAQVLNRMDVFCEILF